MAYLLSSRLDRFRSFVACATLLVFAAGSAAAMTLLGGRPTLGAALEVVAQGNTLFVATDGPRLYILDATNPAAPTELSQVPFGFYALGVDAVPGWALVAAGFQGLAAVNVSNPSSPGAPIFFALGGSAADVAVSGHIAYVANSSFGLQVVDVTNPVAPQLLGLVPGPFPFMGRLHVVGSRLYASSSNTASVTVFDISTPSTPVVIGSRSVAGAGSDAVPLGSLIALGNQLQITVVDGSQPATLPTVVTLNTPGLGLASTGSLLLSGGTELMLRDLSSVAPALPVNPLGGLALPDVAKRLKVAGSLAYVASGFGGLRVVAFSNPALPTELSSVFVGNALSIDVEGNLAYVGEAVDGLRIFDVTNPANPVYVGTADTPGTPLAIDVVGNRAYVADGASGLRIVDVSNPAAPNLLGGIHSGTAVDLAVYAGLVYVVDGSLRIFDVSNPVFPLQRSAYTPTGGANALALAWPLAYLAAPSQTVVLDVSQSTNPQLVATIPVGGTEIELSGRTLYVTNSNGTTLVDVSAPAIPLVKAFHPGIKGEVKRAGSLILSLNGSVATDLQIFDALITPGGFAPKTLQTLPIGNNAIQGITFDPARRLAYLAFGTANAGIAIVDVAADIAANPCINGVDDDGDGLADYPADPGCSLPSDPSEKADCEDGLDNDGDGLVDFPIDPGCRNAAAGSIESPQCSDGADNDGDGQIDFPADTLCQSATDDDEASNPAPAACGLLGIEVLLVAPIARRLVRRRRPGSAS